MSDGVPNPIQIALTPEQQALFQQLTGEHATFLELTPEVEGGSSGAGRGLKFRWRLSEATGIPRREWKPGEL
jgi:hypothetical protein